MKKYNIPFSPPDYSQLEIDEVIDTLKSGWITTGPKTKKFEQRISEYCDTPKTVCLNSATAAMELTLRVLGVGPGDEVITSAYTYTASASVIDHVGAKIVLVDTYPDSWEMDLEQVTEAITENTKVIIPVDIAGIIADYEGLFDVVNKKQKLYRPNNKLQKLFNRIVILADAAHSFGAERNGKKSGSIADFSCFSFHAVKNLTTSEGGAVTWKNFDGLDNNGMYEQFQLFSLHGQNKDALAKTKLGSWEYDIIGPYFKCNMTDINASLGLAQLNRYNQMLSRREEIVNIYNDELKDYVEVLNHDCSSKHLYITRVPNIDLETRNEIIIKMAELGISTNVHYKPLPMHTAYKNLGFDIKNYPNAYSFFENEITLPLHTMLTNDDVINICLEYKRIIDEARSN